MTLRKTDLIVSGRELLVTGRLCKVAHLDADDYKFLEDPAAAIDKLRSAKVRIDLFTFLQKLPDTTPKYD